ncbi:hypothetical protein [Micromonospora sp. HUAS LYJ1]|uniref:hypothetical protein n=1 Tax=Micromonospora sp. HUAS LYJ1 TaxID=3061626 RepID=UPI002672DA02|nr:hypothetical protein [Micromonospora sp. HUAS LYJ1]WKU08047.1 hypothetical protein Q2K16_13955 [Micromonospora sp. HUAS LYJ1]
MATLPNVSLRVLPFTAGPPLASETGTSSCWTSRRRSGRHRPSARYPADHAEPLRGRPPGWAAPASAAPTARGCPENVGASRYGAAHE